jgi:Mg-chelatase subunit ChlD
MRGFSVTQMGKYLMRLPFCFIFRYSSFLIAVSFLWLVTSVAAEQRELANDSKIEKIDAVVLIDASGSMLSTDPQRLRDEGAKLFFQFLKSGDRLGLAQFAEKVKPIRTLSDYESSQGTQLASDLSGISANGAYTDLLGALKYAQAELSGKAREDARQIIIVLSDGRMEPDPSLSNATKDSDELINTMLPSLKSEGIQVHTLYFSEQADKDLLSQIALGSDGVNWFTPNADKIHESYADLFLVVKKPQIVPLSGKSFTIDADIEEATFYINREEGAVVTLESPNKEVINANSNVEGIKWYSGTKFEVITIIKPAPGQWKVTGLANADGFATVLTDLKLITEWPSSFNAQDPVLIQARLYDEKKPVTLPKMTGAVKYGFQILPTDKVSEPIIRSFLNDEAKDGDKIEEDGIFSQAVTVTEPGEYKLTIVAKGPTFTRHQQIPFRVKPRLVTLRVVQKSAEGHHAAEGQHGEEHPEDEQHAKTEADAGEHAATKESKGHESQSEGILGTQNDAFEIVLSPDAASLKSVEVKLVAIDGERRRFTVPVTKVSAKADTIIYQAAASLLPNPGGYKLEASLSGLTNKKERVHAESETLQYIKPVPSQVVEEEQKLVEAKEPEVEGFPFIGFILITLINIASAAGVAFYVRKIIQGGSITLPEMPPIGPLELALAGMKERMSVTALDLTDARFQGASEDAGQGSAAEQVTAEKVSEAPNAQEAEDSAVSEE